MNPAPAHQPVRGLKKRYVGVPLRFIWQNDNQFREIYLQKRKCYCNDFRKINNNDSAIRVPQLLDCNTDTTASTYLKNSIWLPASYLFSF